MAVQGELFDAGTVRTLVDDPTGRIWYRPGILEPGLADRVFARLRDEVGWIAEDRPMYDRVVAVPRLTAALELDRARRDPDLGILVARAEEVAGVRYTSLSLNFYRDRHDSVAWHSDDFRELIVDPVVALVSLGATREMRVRTKERPRRTFRLDLEPGSLFVMAGATQHYWEHHVPKETRLVGPRISVALRQRPMRG